MMSNLFDTFRRFRQRYELMILSAGGTTAGVSRMMLSFSDRSAMSSMTAIGKLGWLSIGRTMRHVSEAPFFWCLDEWMGFAAE